MSTTTATADDVKRLAALARIEIPEEDLARYVSEFDAILAYIGKLSEMPIAQTGNVVPPVRNVLRPDEAPYESETWTEAVVAQFPVKEGNSLSVKKIISHD